MKFEPFRSSGILCEVVVIVSVRIGRIKVKSVRIEIWNFIFAVRLRIDDFCS